MINFSPAKLNYQIIEGNNTKKERMIIIHGLFCSNKTFKSFIENKDILSCINLGVLIELRNHGDSEQTEDMYYEDMAYDIYSLLIYLNFTENNILLGHSIGGKVVMQLAIMFPNMFTHTIVVDVAPIDMNLFRQKFPFIPFMINVIKGLKNLNLNQQFNFIFEKVLELCRPENHSLAVAICENLLKIDDKQYKMKLNLETILNNYYRLVGNITFREDYKKFKGKAKIICGKNSNGVLPEFFDSFKQVFEYTDNIIEFIPESRHWVHLENPDEFVKSVLKFLN